MNRLSLAPLGLTALLIVACQPGNHRSTAKGVHVAAPVTLPAPAACSASSGEAPKLVLPRTEAPRVATASASSQIDIAQVHTVNRSLADVGVWQTRADGWSTLGLQISSSGARTLAVRLRELKMPAQTEVWLCGADGTQRLGPFREARNGEIWTPESGGTQVRLEIWVPSVERQVFSGFLADVYGGYR